MARGTDVSRWLTDAELEALEESEEFDFGSIARALGGLQKHVGTALPGAVQGATAGASLGWPGALIGGLTGAASSLSAKGKRPPTAAPSVPVPPPAPVPPPPAPATPALAAPVATSPGAAPTAAGQLFQLLRHPALEKLIAAVASGQKSEAGGAPAAAVLNLLGTLANNAAYEAEATLVEADDDSYLRGPDGSYVGDPSVPADRAAVVWNRLFRSGAPPASSATSTSDAEWLIEGGLAERV